MKSLRPTMFALALVGGLLSQAAFAANYVVDSAHSSINFTIKHLMSNVTGSFGDITGNFSFDPAHIDQASGKFASKTASINTNNAKRDEHLRSADFFDAAKNPELTVVATKLKRNGKDKYKMETIVTMRGTPNPVTFDVEYLGSTEFNGVKKLGFSAHGVIKRKDFGMTWNKALDQGGFVLGEDVKLDIQIQANEVKAAVAQEKPAAPAKK